MTYNPGGHARLSCSSLTVSLLSASIFSALAGFSQNDRNLSLAMEIKVTTQVDLKEYHLTNCHIGEMEELFGEEESCSLQNRNTTGLLY